MDATPGRRPLLGEQELEKVELRLRRVMFGAFGLDALLVVVLLSVIRQWATLPAVMRVGYGFILLWSMVVTAYAFYSYVQLSQRMRDGFRQRGFIDEITGVFNYRYLELRLAEEGERTRRHGGFTAVLYLDLDHFKEVNDRYGHQVGNLVLQQIANLMLQQVRSCDVFGRIGGDEFLAVLPQTDRREAYVLAERLRRAVENYRLEIGNRVTVDFIRVSIGIAAYPINGETMDNVVTAADKAVYESKEQGGNRVSVAGEFIAAESAGGDILAGLRQEDGGRQS